MTDEKENNVVGFKTGKPIEVEQEEVRKAEELHERVVDQKHQENKEKMLEMLSRCAELIRSGQMDSMAIAGRSPNSGAFLSEFMIPEGSRTDVYLAYGGILESMKMETVDMAAAGVTMLPDGSFICISNEIESMEEDDEDD